MKIKKPRIKLALTDFDRLLERFGLLEVLFLWVYVMVIYKSLPQSIPSHFNFSGKIDSYGDKSLLFILPGIMAILYTGLSILNNYPHIFNYPVAVTNENAEKLYTLATSLIRWLKCIIALLFIFLTVQIVEGAKHGGSSMRWWDIPLILLLVNIPVVIFLYKSTKVGAAG